MDSPKAQERERKLTGAPVRRFSRDTWRKASLQELTSAVKTAKVRSANLGMRIDVIRRQMLSELQRLPSNSNSSTVLPPDTTSITTNGRPLLLGLFIGGCFKVGKIHWRRFEINSSLTIMATN